MLASYQAAVLAKPQFAQKTLEICVTDLILVLNVVLLEDLDQFWLAQHAANYNALKYFVIVLCENSFEAYI